MKTKLCSTCDTQKAIGEFNKKSSNKDGLERYCRNCHRERNRQHYAKNKAAYKAAAKKFKQELREWFQQLKATKTCVRCGENKPWRLAFHHKGKKELEVSGMITAHASRARILKEIARCDVVCHNCHADIHHGQSKDVRV